MNFSTEEIVIIDQALERAIDDCEYCAEWEKDKECIAGLKKEAADYQQLRVRILQEVVDHE